MSRCAPSVARAGARHHRASARRRDDRRVIRTTGRSPDGAWRAAAPPSSSTVPHSAFTVQPSPLRHHSSMPPDRVRVVVADDHPLFREGIERAVRERPELELVAAAAEGRDALAAIREHEPHVAVLDLRLPGLDGLQILNAVVRDGMPSRVLFLSASGDPELVYRAVQMRRGRLLPQGGRPRGDPRRDRGGRARRHGDRPGSSRRGVFDQVRLRGTGEDRPILTAREREVLTLMAEGLTGPQIAERLIVALPTVKTYQARCTRSSASPSAPPPSPRRCGAGCWSDRPRSHLLLAALASRWSGRAAGRAARRPPSRSTPPPSRSCSPPTASGPPPCSPCVWPARRDAASCSIAPSRSSTSRRSPRSPTRPAARSRRPRWRSSSCRCWRRRGCGRGVTAAWALGAIGALHPALGRPPERRRERGHRADDQPGRLSGAGRRRRDAGVVRSCSGATRDRAAGRAARAARRARADRRAARAPPPRRAAARRVGADALARASGARRLPAHGPRGVVRARARARSTRRWRSCAARSSSCTRTCSTTPGWPPRCARSPTAARERMGAEITVAVDPAADGRHDELIVVLVRELLTNAVKHSGAAPRGRHGGGRRRADRARGARRRRAASIPARRERVAARRSHRPGVERAARAVGGRRADRDQHAGRRHGRAGRPSAGRMTGRTTGPSSARSRARPMPRRTGGDEHGRTCHVRSP